MSELEAVALKMGSCTDGRVLYCLTLTCDLHLYKESSLQPLLKYTH